MLWRRAPRTGRLRLRPLHRPGYDDGPRPGGGPRGGGDPLAAAPREAAGETGHAAVPGAAPPTGHAGRPTEVRHRAAGAGAFVPSDGVVRVRWLPPAARPRPARPPRGPRPGRRPAPDGSARDRSVSVT